MWNIIEEKWPLTSPRFCWFSGVFMCCPFQACTVVLLSKETNHALTLCEKALQGTETLDRGEEVDSEETFSLRFLRYLAVPACFRVISGFLRIICGFSPLLEKGATRHKTVKKSENVKRTLENMRDWLTRNSSSTKNGAETSKSGKRWTKKEDANIYIGWLNEQETKKNANRWRSGEWRGRRRPPLPTDLNKWRILVLE